MSGGALKIISEAMTALELKYSFMEYTADAGEALPATYFVGEYQELETENESGEEDSIFILNGFSRKDRVYLEQAKEKIKKYFPAGTGRTERTENGVAAVFYENSFPVPLEDEELKRMQINLKVKEWRIET